MASSVADSNSLPVLLSLSGMKDSIVFGQQFFRAFASSLPHVPIQVLAVTGSSSGASIIFHDDNTTLFNDSSNMSSKLAAKFQSSTRQGEQVITQLAITCSKLIIETLEQGVKYLQS